MILGMVKMLLGVVAGEKIISFLQHFPKSLLGIMVLAAGVELAKVGQSLEETRDLWEEAEHENEDAVQDLDKRRRWTEQERKNRWAVMLVTVAGCLAFKNDAVGFVAGLTWHWGLRLPNMLHRWRRGRMRSVVRSIPALECWDTESETEGLLEHNEDAFE